MDFTTLYFRYRPSISDLSILSSIISIAKAWEPVESIPNESVVIRISRGKMANVSVEEVRKAMKLKDGHITLLLNMLMSGTKPFDAILCLSIAKLEDGSKLDNIFKFVPETELDKDAVSPSLALVTACLMILVTRGSFPASNVASGHNPLPKFIVSMINGLTDETSLRDASMSFDPKNISMKGLFNEESLKGWPSVVANRMNLGVAGHKTIKLASAIGENYRKDDDREAKLFQVLLDKAGAMNGGFYAVLHPANNSAQSKFPRFYLNTLVLCYRIMNGTHDAKIKFIKNMGGFDNEQKLDKESFLKNAVLDYVTWNPEDLSEWLDHPVKFGVYEEVSQQAKEGYENPVDIIGIEGANITSSSLARVLIQGEKEKEKEILPTFTTSSSPQQYSTSAIGASSKTSSDVGFGDLQTKKKGSK